MEPWESFEVPPRIIPTARTAVDEGEENKGQGEGDESKSSSIPRPYVAEARPETRLLATAANIPRPIAELNSEMRGMAQVESLHQNSQEAGSMTNPRAPATSSVTGASAHIALQAEK